jgi:hypothetical protein
MRPPLPIALLSVLAVPAPAQNTTLSIGLPSAPLSVFGLQFTADHFGPPMATITKTRAKLRFTTSTLDAADLVLLIQAPSAGVPIWTFSGADLGWSGTGTFTANVATDELDGPIDLGSPLPTASLFFVSISAAGFQPLGGTLEMSEFAIDLDPWTDLGGGLAGSLPSAPRLSASGPLAPAHRVALALAGAPANSAGVLIAGGERIDAPLFGGILVPEPSLAVPVTVGPAGTLALDLVWPAGVPAGATLFLQVWTIDPAGPQGLAGSNGVGVVVPNESPARA